MSLFRLIPSIDELRRRPAIRALEAQFGPDATVDALRASAELVRQAIAQGTSSHITERIEQGAVDRLSDEFRPSLEPVINATGVVIHTNLGRAPLPTPAIARMAAVARAYSSIEYDLGRGARGRRDVHAEPLLCRLTGAEAALVVNNNAAATLVILAALAAGREVVVSRGELIEIGGGFRVPDVMAQSGAVLREVGTTNKTRTADYGAAIGDRTALILRVHPSNFQIKGFTERPALTELVALGRRFNVPVVEDLGSGHLSNDRHHPLTATEPSVGHSIAAGVDLCTFSGDKLVGGPQAGLIVGRRELMDRVGRHPLMRALRVDKMTYAALEATLAEHLSGRAAATVPVQRMLTTTADEIRRRADAIGPVLEAAGYRVEIVQGVSAVGGGSAPDVGLPTWLVVLEKAGVSPDALEEQLRRSTPAVVARIERDRVLLDLRTVFPEQDAELASLLGRL